MNFKITTKKYVEQSNHINELTSVFTHLSKDLEISQLRGQVYTVVNLNGPTNLDAVTATNVFLDHFESEYFSNTPSNIPSILEKSIRTSLFSLNSFFEEKHLGGGDILFDFACVVIREDILYVGKVEAGNIYLIRNNKSLDIGKSLPDISNPKLVDFGSGELQAGDKIIIANAVADEVITDWPLLSRYSESEINRLIQPGMHGEEKMAFLIVEIDHDDSKVEKRFIDSLGEDSYDAATPYTAEEGQETYFDADGEELSKFGMMRQRLRLFLQKLTAIFAPLLGHDGVVSRQFSRLKTRSQIDQDNQVSQVKKYPRYNRFSDENRTDGVKALVTNLRNSNGLGLPGSFHFKSLLGNKVVWAGVPILLVIFFL